MTEEKLTQAAQRLGARAAERLDVEATARKVVERLREQPVRRSVWVHATWLRIAAAIVVVAGGAVALSRVWPTDTDDHVAHFIADDLRDLSTDELRTLLTSFDQIIDESAPDSSSDLQELDAQELRELLREG
jgi:hypothetical protein